MSPDAVTPRRAGYRPVAPAALAGPRPRGDDGRVAVLAVLAVIVIWRYAIRGKGDPAARLAAVLCAVIVVWTLVAMKDPGPASKAASAFASGASAAASGLGRFIGFL